MDGKKIIRVLAIAFVGLWIVGATASIIKHNTPEPIEETKTPLYEEVIVPVSIVTLPREEVKEDEHRILDTDISADWSDYTEPQASYEEEETEVHPVETYTFTEDEIWEMTRIVYLENGIDDASTDYTLYLTACVILNRLYDWGECNTIYEVIWERGQYSTADRYTDYNGGELGSSYPEGWSKSYNAVCEAIENTDRNPHFQSTFAQGTVYYTDPYTGETFCY